MWNRENDCCISRTINKLLILIEGNIYKNLICTHMKCNNIPRLCRIIFTKIANNRDYVYSFCYRPLNGFDKHCREWFFLQFTKK